jgi:hypothetical protein
MAIRWQKKSAAAAVLLPGYMACPACPGSHASALAQQGIQLYMLSSFWKSLKTRYSLTGQVIGRGGKPSVNIQGCERHIYCNRWQWAMSLSWKGVLIQSDYRGRAGHGLGKKEIKMFPTQVKSFDESRETVRTYPGRPRRGPTGEGNSGSRPARATPLRSPPSCGAGCERQGGNRVARHGGACAGAGASSARRRCCPQGACSLCCL